MSKISEWSQVQSFEQSDLINIVRNSTNYTVPFSAYAASLGVTGVINPVGGGTAIAILEQPSSTVNNIRGIEATNGIIAALSAQNGISLRQNFTYDSTGESLMVDSSAASPVFKSLVAGTDISISTSGSSVVFNVMQGSGSDVVTVNSEEDFPVAVAGVITLTANTVYVISSAFSITNRIVLSNNSSIFGYNLFGPLLTYTGTGTMFTSANATIAITDMQVTAPNGKVFDCSTTGFNIVSLRNVNIQSCAAIGTFTGLLALAIDNCVCINAAQGLNFTGAGWSLISIIDLGLISTSASFIAIDLGDAVAENISIKGCQFNGPSGSIGIKGAASNANLTATGRGEIAQMLFVGDITQLSGISIANDVQWHSQENQGIIDTHPDSLSSNTAGVTVTIAGVDTPTLIAGTWVDSGSQHFTVSGSGRVTYNGVDTMAAPITLSVTADPVSGSAKDFIVYIAVNGTPIIASGVPSRASASDRSPVTVIWQYEFSTNDYVEAFIANETDAIDFDVIHSVLRIN